MNQFQWTIRGDYVAIALVILFPELFAWYVLFWKNQR